MSQDPLTNQVVIKFRDVTDLLVILRNRFFHSRTGDGKNNITVTQIINSDEFFGCVNMTFCSFLAIVALQTLAYQYQS